VKSDIQKVREKLGLDRHQFGLFLGLTYESLMNIENGVRNPSILASKVVAYIDKLPKAKALAFIEECNRHEPK
jgi:DNA-binding XRE family transcriptional regulator